MSTLVRSKADNRRALTLAQASSLPHADRVATCQAGSLARESTEARSVRTRQIAESRLRSSSYGAVRTISCDYDDGVLILRGRVSAYYLKQVAQAAVAELDGVLKIANHIEVVRPAKRLCHASHDGPAAFASRDITGGGDRP